VIIGPSFNKKGHLQGLFAAIKGKPFVFKTDVRKAYVLAVLESRKEPIR
jgi:hypothetical protein